MKQFILQRFVHGLQGECHTASHGHSEVLVFSRQKYQGWAAAQKLTAWPNGWESAKVAI